MGFERVLIFGGKLCIPGSFLDFQVSDKNGNPVTFDYRGEAYCEGQHLGIASGVHVYDYVIAQTATPESTAKQNGWDYARRQQRQRWPKGKCSDFIFGYAACWRYRKGKEDSIYANQDFSYRAE